MGEKLINLCAERDNCGRTWDLVMMLPFFKARANTHTGTRQLRHVCMYWSQWLPLKCELCLSIGGLRDALPPAAFACVVVIAVPTLRGASALSRRPSWDHAHTCSYLHTHTVLNILYYAIYIDISAFLRSLPWKTSFVASHTFQFVKMRQKVHQ